MRTEKIAVICYELPGCENVEVRRLANSIKDGGYRVKLFAADGLKIAHAVQQAIKFNPGVMLFHIQYPVSGLIDLAWTKYAVKLGFAGKIICTGPETVLQNDWILKTIPEIYGIFKYDADSGIVRFMDAVAGRIPFSAVPGLKTREFSTSPSAHCSDRCSNWRILREKKQPEILNIKTAGMIATKACPFRCGYCDHAAVAALKQKEYVKSGIKSDLNLYNRRPIKEMAEEMAELYHRKNVRYFYFADENPLPQNEKQALLWISEIKEHLKRHNMENVSFGMNTRGDRLTPEIIYALTELGMARTLMGVESLNRNGLHGIDRKGNCENGLSKVRQLGSNKVVVLFNILLLHKESTPKTVLDELSRLHNIDYGLFNIFAIRPLPGTPVYKDLKKQGMVRGNHFFNEIVYDDPVMESFQRGVVKFKKDVLGPYEPSLYLHDLLLSVVLNRKSGNKKLSPDVEISLWNFVEKVNDAQVLVFERLMHFAIRGDQSDLIIAEAQRTFSRLRLEMDSISRAMKGATGVNPSNHYANVAAASVVSIFFGISAAGCDNVSPLPSEDECIAATVDTPVDTDPIIDTYPDLKCSEEDADAEYSSVVDLVLSGCGFDIHQPANKVYQSGTTLSIDNNGKVAAIYFDGEENLENWENFNFELAKSCLEELFKDEVFECSAGGSFRYFYIIAD